MIRTQIQLTEDQARELKKLAVERNVSMAELIRESVDLLLRDSEENEQWLRASRLVGRYRSDHTDIAREHDRYLDEIYGQ